MKNLQVRVTDTDPQNTGYIFHHNQLCGTNNAATSGQWTTIYCSQNTQGRYVSVQNIAKSEDLNFCEFQVYGMYVKVHPFSCTQAIIKINYSDY